MLKDEDKIMKNKPIIQEKSSEKVAKFLDKNSLHKKDFAEMIGVTLSYVYNLIDNTIPFSTRGTTPVLWCLISGHWMRDCLLEKKRS